MTDVNRLSERQLLRVLNGTPVFVRGVTVGTVLDKNDMFTLIGGHVYRLEAGDAAVFAQFHTSDSELDPEVTPLTRGVKVAAGSGLTFVARHPHLYVWMLTAAGTSDVKLFTLA